VRIFLLLPATPTRAVNGRSRPMSVRFPIRTCRCRSSEDAYSLLGQRVCAYRERWTLPQNSELSLETIIWASFFVISNTWHLICNDFTSISYIWYCLFYVMCLCILASPRISWYDLGRQTSHFWGGSVTIFHHNRYYKIFLFSYKVLFSMLGASAFFISKLLPN
jgi:hypothetical protein